jgi:serine/threonine protein kinase
LNLKLVDFGLAEVVDADRGDCVIYGSVGSQPYTAPEVYYNKDIHESQGYKGEPADVWSCAVSLYIMLTGRPPFRRSLNKTYGPLLKKCSHFSSLLSGSYPSRVSAMAKDLLRKMFLLDPSERPTVEEILQHPWCSDKLPAREEILMQMREFAERAWIKQDKNWMADIMLEITPEPQKSEAPAENENEYKQLETAVSEFELFSLSS